MLIPFATTEHLLPSTFYRAPSRLASIAVHVSTSILSLARDLSCFSSEHSRSTVDYRIECNILTFISYHLSFVCHMKPLQMIIIIYYSKGFPRIHGGGLGTRKGKGL